MPRKDHVRLRAQRLTQNRAKTGVTRSEEQDDSALKAAAALQNGKRDVHDLSSNEIVHLQRALGNQAVMRLINKTPHSTNSVIQAKRNNDLMMEEEAPTAVLESSLPTPTIVPDTATPPTIQRGFFSKGKGNVSKGGFGETAQVGGTATTGFSVFTAVKKALNLLKGIKDAGGKLIGGVLGEMSNLLSGLAIPGFMSLIKRILELIAGYQEMKSLETAKKALTAKENLTPQEEDLKEAATHGYAKVRRRFWKALYLVISSIVKVASHLITVLSGGTSAMVSEVVALGAVALEGVKTLYEKGKGFIKWLLNKRGAHRKQSADRILASAQAGDAIALQLLVDMDPIGVLGRQKRALKYGYGDPPKPTTIREMQALMTTFETDPERFGSIAELQEDIAKRLKST